MVNNNKLFVESSLAQKSIKQIIVSYFININQQQLQSPANKFALNIFQLYKAHPSQNCFIVIKTMSTNNQNTMLNQETQPATKNDLQKLHQLMLERLNKIDSYIDIKERQQIMFKNDLDKKIDSLSQKQNTLSNKFMIFKKQQQQINKESYKAFDHLDEKLGKMDLKMCKIIPTVEQRYKQTISLTMNIQRKIFCYVNTQKQKIDTKFKKLYKLIQKQDDKMVVWQSQFYHNTKILFQDLESKLMISVEEMLRINMGDRLENLQKQFNYLSKQIQKMQSQIQIREQNIKQQNLLISEQQQKSLKIMIENDFEDIKQKQSQLNKMQEIEQNLSQNSQVSQILNQLINQSICWTNSLLSIDKQIRNNIYIIICRLGPKSHQDSITILQCFAGIYTINGNQITQQQFQTYVAAIISLKNIKVYQEVDQKDNFQKIYQIIQKQYQQQKQTNIFFGKSILLIKKCLQLYIKSDLRKEIIKSVYLHMLYIYLNKLTGIECMYILPSIIYAVLLQYGCSQQGYNFKIDLSSRIQNFSQTDKDNNRENLQKYAEMLSKEKQE